MMTSCLKKLFLIIFIATGSSGFGQDSVSVTYVANDGYMFSDGEHKVLIDCLFYLEGSKWHSPTRSTRDRMVNGEKPFDDVDAVIVTHAHRDHNDPDLLARFLAKNQAVLIAPPQVVERLADKWKGTAFTAPANFYQSKEFRVGKLRITALTLHHVGNDRKTQNTVVLVDFSDLSILHAGDADLKDLYEAKIPGTDIVMLSFWQGFDNEMMSRINGNIRSMHVIFKHSPYESIAETADRIRKNYGTKTAAYSLFRETFETIQYSREGDKINSNPVQPAYSPSHGRVIRSTR